MATNLEKKSAQAINRVQNEFWLKKLMPAMEFFKVLGTGMVQETHFKALLVRAYNLAVAQNNWNWVLDAQENASLFFSADWILTNLSHRDEKLNKVHLPKIKNRSKPRNVQLLPAVPSPLTREVTKKEIDIKSSSKSHNAAIARFDGAGNNDIEIQCEGSLPVKDTKASHVEKSDDGINITITLSPSTDEGGQAVKSPEWSQKLVSVSAGTLCPLKGCGIKVGSLKFHVSNHHLPRLFKQNVLMDNPKFHERRIEALRYLRLLLLGKEGPIEDLVPHVKGSALLRENCDITPKVANSMVALCKHMGWQVPNQFNLHKMNSLACLIHWRCLVAVLNKVSANQQAEFRTRFKSKIVMPDVKLKVKAIKTTLLPNQPKAITQNKSVATRTVNRETSPSSAEVATLGMGLVAELIDVLPLPAIDSHMHLDRTAFRVARTVTNPLLDDILKVKLSQTPRNPVTLMGAVAVYCDPHNFPKSFPSDPRLRIAIGVNPKRIKYLTPAREEVISRMLASSSLIALGEIGLDLTEPQDTWPNQQEVFCKMLSYAQTRFPLILHLMGDKSEHGRTLYSRALSLVKEHCGAAQLIHLHCFQGQKDDVLEWLSCYRNCYFGFTGLVTSFSEAQILALKEVPSDRLLLETDSPYFPFPGLDISTPAFIGDVGEQVAKARGMNYGMIMRIAYENAWQLYRFG